MTLAEQRWQMADRLQAYRKAQGLTLVDLAVRYGVSTAQVKNWERGVGEPGAALLADLDGLPDAGG